jgi:hydroxymethylpyrimidine/phosphomethylpyrimidine kinase
MKGRVLGIAGSDSGGGAGLQADIKTITALGGFAMTAVTAVTAQNTRGVQAVFPIPAAFVGAQIDAVLSDLGADCLKTGMLHDAAIIAAVADRVAGLPLVLDPVMVASTGQRLLDEAAVGILKQRLIPQATVLTPNLPEAEALTGIAITRVDDMRRAGLALLALGAKAVLVKGGHLQSELLVDLLLDADGEMAIETPRLAARGTHGTGCSFAAATATGLAQGLTLRGAVRRAHAFVQGAIRGAPGYGTGHNRPLDHGHAIPDYTTEK